MTSFFDTSVRRESACPVHFVWDGNGAGRPVVRVGFLLLLLASMVVAAGAALHLATVIAAGKLGVAVAGGVWLCGQGLTKLAARATRSAP
jgi:hypothetical protein